MTPQPVRRWPLFLIAAPAAVAVWSGWVGLGQMCGFGLVTPFPGIVAWHLNTAITLPVGVEAYGAYAMGAWLAPAGVPSTARKFARRSAVGALLLGMLGQVAYHVLAAAHRTRAPWPVVVLVACLPVVTLGFGAALTHLLRGAPESAPETAPGEHPGNAPEAAPGDAPGEHAESTPETAPGPAPESAPRAHLKALPQYASESTPEALRKRTRTRSRRAPGKRTRTAPVTREDAESEFAAVLASGQVPSIREIRAALHVGQDRGRELRDHLATLTTTSQ